MGFSECDPILDERPLRQGDLIRSIATETDLFAAIGIIVTADCDIARDKHFGLLSFVPVLPVEKFLSLFFLPKRLDSISDAVGNQLMKSICSFQQSNRPDFSQPLSEIRALSWLREVGADSVADALRVTDRGARKKFVHHADSYICLTKAVGGTFTEQSSAHNNAAFSLGRFKSADDAGRRLSSDIESFLTKLPGDALFLNRLSAELNGGYVAYLRLLREIRDQQIALRTMRRPNEVTSERFARLKPPYIYHLTQKLAAVFSAIGLPTEYEDERAINAKFALPMP